MAEEGLEIKPGVVELLKYAADKKYRIALATSSRREHASTLLKEQGLWEYFDGAVFGDMVTCSKPSPEIYQKACATIGVDPANAVALEVLLPVSGLQWRRGCAPLWCRIW